MIKRAVKIIAFTIFFLSILMLYSSMVSHVVRGGEKLGFLSEPLCSFFNTPQNFVKALKQVSSPPLTFLPTDKNFKEINNLNYNLFGLHSYHENGTWHIDLMNFKNDSVKYQWIIKDNDKSKLNYSSNERLFHSLIVDKYNLIISIHFKGLVRLDENSNILWVNNEFGSHHSINLDYEGNIWSPGYEVDEDFLIIPYKRYIEKTLHNFKDEIIVKVDAKTGKTLFKKSLTDIFMENGIDHWLSKAADPVDPFHVNDIEPILEDSEYLKKGDIIISLRHLSMLLIYRPLTNKVINVITGPHTYQHDVDIVSSNKISFFNNNAFNNYLFGIYEDFSNKESPLSKTIATDYSNIIMYDIEKDSFYYHLQDQFKSNEIYSLSEGLIETLPNGDVFVEEQNTGIYWVLNESGVVMKKVIPTKTPGYHHLPNWVRIINEN